MGEQGHTRGLYAQWARAHAHREKTSLAQAIDLVRQKAALRPDREHHVLLGAECEVRHASFGRRMGDKRAGRRAHETREPVLDEGPKERVHLHRRALRRSRLHETEMEQRFVQLALEKLDLEIGGVDAPTAEQVKLIDAERGDLGKELLQALGPGDGEQQIGGYSSFDFLFQLALDDEGALRDLDEDGFPLPTPEQTHSKPATHSEPEHIQDVFCARPFERKTRTRDAVALEEEDEVHAGRLEGGGGRVRRRTRPC